nr:MAG TPA: hypothetical protein [Caudoviricetes sp.]DAN29806.1 MAG TPA: hypothetical protein [Caudoviricetes sp.]
MKYRKKPVVIEAVQFKDNGNVWYKEQSCKCCCCMECY